eukprot:9497908-Pyramimonas_sp.AAC.1
MPRAGVRSEGKQPPPRGPGHPSSGSGGSSRECSSCGRKTVRRWSSKRPEASNDASPSVHSGTAVVHREQSIASLWGGVSQGEYRVHLCTCMYKPVNTPLCVPQRSHSP